MACSQLQLDEPTGSGNKTESTDEVLSLSDAISVEEALQRRVGEEVVVGGFYVGYANGSTLSDALFSESYRAENTNLLLASDDYCDDEDAVFPVRLMAGSRCREELNTYSHPELHRVFLLIRGTLETYFGVNGIKSPKAWKVVGYYEDVKDQLGEMNGDKKPDDTPQEDENEGGKDEGGEDAPDVAPVTPKDKLPTINWLGTPASRAY